MICLHGASKKFEKGLVTEQEVLNNIAEMMMETYLSESLALRVEKIESITGSAALYRDILDVNIYDTADKVRKSAFDALYSIMSPDSAQSFTKAIEELTRVAGVDVKESRRRIAAKLIEDNVYKF
jgi:hypothetical protein